MQVLNSKRGELGSRPLSLFSFDLIATAMWKCLDIYVHTFVVVDIKNISMMASTFYIENQSGKKQYLTSRIKQHQIWKDQQLWEDTLLNAIQTQFDSSPH